jgi:hypothetical protein
MQRPLADIQLRSTCDSPDCRPRLRVGYQMSATVSEHPPGEIRFVTATSDPSPVRDEQASHVGTEEAGRIRNDSDLIGPSGADRS